ncbi:MAG: hypothetical protein JWP75_3001 [Frondihabitans sp.]|nr:hypothetical protein [Frondihabitans sp.]
MRTRFIDFAPAPGDDAFRYRAATNEGAVQINKLRIDGQMFFLEPTQDITQLKQQILDSARGVAEFIEFQPMGHGRVSVLMTPQTPVRFEVEEHSEEELSDWAANPPNMDIEGYEG